MKMKEIESNFEDILEARRKETSNFMWISRQLNTVIAYKQLKKPSPKCHKLEVIQSPKMQEIMKRISEEQHVPKEEVQQKILLILDEIGYNKRLSVIRWLGLILTKISKNVCSGILINTVQILKLKQLMGNVPVIFIPSHRSYADFILMSFICFTYDIEIPAIAAGMDFHGMWGMGTVLRDTGAFFMRRIYNNDYLYWDTFQQYINQLITKGDLPIEFFIEGTRSRSGKSLKPKFGFLSMILKSFFTSQVPDILFVPINISYDRVLEEKLFAYELLGVPKPKESTSGFFKSLSIVKEQYGNIYVDFAKPISAREYFDSDINRSVHSIKPIHMQEITPNEKVLATFLAHDIIYAQQKSCVITTFNLMALSLTDSFISGKMPINFDDFVNDVNELQQILKVCGGRTDMRNAVEDISAALHVHQNLVKVDDDMTVNLVQHVIMGNLSNNKLKGYTFSQETMMLAVPQVTLQIYVNPLLHYIIDAAFIYIILKCKGNMCKDTLFGHFAFLRLLFALEFVTTAKQDSMDFESSLNHLQKLRLINFDLEMYCLSHNGLTVFYSILQPFILAYYTICNVLSQPLQEHNEQMVIISAQYRLEKIIKTSKQFIHPYCLCLDVLKNCLLSLSSMNVLKRTNRNGKMYCCANKSISSVIQNIECLLCVKFPEMDSKYAERNVIVESKL